ncbi:hypothetical protein KSU1_C0193 [Candidatus Jettenia caeni]|uniref:Uncharacterized protein n=1 Tax=Candidatus Jettenia caeni TaxID=247490 RepID=I3IJ94_9BACT|nr:hypothetical protein KSU1_C0193 [Candidatus Jettenia caeni]
MTKASINLQELRRKSSYSKYCWVIGGANLVFALFMGKCKGFMICRFNFAPYFE